jgi:hypothetical protein
MLVRPSKLWKDMPPDKRLAAADAFWRDNRGSGAVDPQKVEVIVAIARRLNFRPKSVQALSTERRAKQLSQMPDVSDAVATRALIAYHLLAQRPMMRTFLDAVGLAHEDGIITTDDIPAPDASRLAAGVAALKASFPPGDVALYLTTLMAIDGDTWGGMDGLLPVSD